MRKVTRAARAAGAMVAGVLLTGTWPAEAAPILPAPGASAADGQLGALATGFQEQEDVFATAENGLSLDIYVNPPDVATVRSFFAQDAGASFQAFTGKHPFTVVQTFAEWGDEGNFAGISSVAVAARLMVLERDGGSATEIASARSDAIAAARAWHVYGAIAGPGFVARGVRRTTPLDPTAPPLPGGPPPPTVPLHDAQGNPLPNPKAAVWRAPVASGFDGWIWMDDTSKDQVSGYALAAAWLWDALHGDPLVPADVTQNLATDLVAFANELQKIAPENGLDLCIRDADGRLTDADDLNPRLIVPGGNPVPVTSSLRNGFNAALALGIIRAAYHVSGDPALGRYYYDDLVGTRDFPGEMASNSGILIFLGPETNFSNVNMLAIALATLGRFETDPYVRSRLVATLQSQFWSTGNGADVSHDLQAWYDVIYAGHTPGVTADIAGRMRTNLGGFQPAPAFERDRINCDDAGIASGVCTAVDGTTIQLDTQGGHGGELVASQVVPMAIRPDSDFEWRSSPFRVNGTASNLMDPRGDWLTAYWLGRLYDTDPTKNLSPNARPPLPYTMGDGGASDDAGDDAGADAAAPSPAPSARSSGCGCGVVGSLGVAWGATASLGLLGLAMVRRRRTR